MDDTMRDDLSAALDSVAEDDETQSYDETPQEITESDEPAEPAAEEPAPDAPAPDAPAPVLTPDEPLPAAASDDKPDTRSLKAPVDWSPKEREDWSRIPRHLQDKIASREKAMQVTMERTAGDRQTANEFTKLANSYGPILKGVAGDSPMKAVENLFSMAANLRMGTKSEKAQTIANLIKSFDVDINSLDGLLVGESPSVSQHPQDLMQQMIDKQLAPIMNQYQNQQQQQDIQVKDNARNEVQAFSEQAEFLEDVRHDMADLIDMASARGQNMPMNDAYAKACAMNPQIQAVLQQRQEQQRITGGNSNMAGKRLAASSITGNRGGGGGGGTGISLRDTIADAWDTQGS